MNIPRRHVLKGLAGLSLAAVLADPRLARATADSLTTVRLTTAGGREVGAAMAQPDTGPAAAVMLIHEWRGQAFHVAAN